MTRRCAASCCGKSILPQVQYFAYVEITKRSHQALWQEYEKLTETHGDVFAQRHITQVADIFPTFRDLFAKKLAA